MDSNVLDRVRDSLQEFLTSKGLRRTVQREAIIDAAFGTNEHFTAEELLVMARRIEKSVSRATVYRTLPLLVQSGLLHELDLGSDTKIYDPNFVEHPTHNHLICVDCDKNHRVRRHQHGIAGELHYQAPRVFSREQGGNDRRALRRIETEGNVP